MKSTDIFYCLRRQKNTPVDYCLDNYLDCNYLSVKLCSVASLKSLCHRCRHGLKVRRVYANTDDTILSLEELNQLLKLHKIKNPIKKKKD